MSDKPPTMDQLRRVAIKAREDPRAMDELRTYARLHPVAVDQAASKMRSVELALSRMHRADL